MSVLTELTDTAPRTTRSVVNTRKSDLFFFQATVNW